MRTRHVVPDAVPDAVIDAVIDPVTDAPIRAEGRHDSHATDEPAASRRTRAPAQLPQPLATSTAARAGCMRLTAALLVVALLGAPAAPVRASAPAGGSTSRVGVVLMMACGVSLKAAIVAPVPWAGVAVMSCLFGLLDAAMSPDESAPSGDGKP